MDGPDLCKYMILRMLPLCCKLAILQGFIHNGCMRFGDKWGCNLLDILSRPTALFSGK